MSAPRLVLASASPRRAQLLAEARIPFEARPVDVDERAPRRAAPADAALAIALRKARAAPHPGAWVLAADTVVAHHGHLLGKPFDETEAHAILRLLSGDAHEVVTGVVVVPPEGEPLAEAARTTVVFRELSDEEIDAYIRTGEPMDKAGAYGIQGKGRAFVARVDGPLDNVVGLPMEVVRRLLARASFPLAG